MTNESVFNTSDTNERLCYTSHIEYFLKYPPIVIPGQAIAQIRGSNSELPFPMNSYYTYILASHRFGTLYTGVTNDLVRRTYEHKEGSVEGFTSRYDVKLLVWYEVHATILAAIQREKNIKHWSRDWKIQLIEKMNPAWNDLYNEICG